MDKEYMLSIPDAAEELGVSSTVVRRLMERGELPTAREYWRGKQRIRLVRMSDVSSLKRQRQPGQESNV